MEKWKQYSVHNEHEIRGFFGDYRFLSNYHKCPVYFDGVLYPSTENAYMAAKTLDVAERTRFLEIEPKEAKLLGRQIQLRSDWESVKFDIMASVLFDKFYRNRSLREKLLKTENAILIEANHWGDRIWGTDEEGNGENHLGRTLMRIRKFWKDENRES
jgi:ribA/ribD-fused uncharacterized protein